MELIIESALHIRLKRTKWGPPSPPPPKKKINEILAFETKFILTFSTQFVSWHFYKATYIFFFALTFVHAINRNYNEVYIISSRAKILLYSVIFRKKKRPGSG